MTTPLIIVPGESSWQLAALDGDNVVAETVDAGNGEAIAKLGRQGQPVWIALRSSDCLAASLDLAAFPRRHRHEAMLYALEERLPVVIEECAADLVIGPVHALGVVVPFSVAAPLVSQVNAAGLSPRVVTPAALLALRHIESLQNHDGLVVITDGPAADIFLLERGCPRLWQVAEHTPASLTQRLQFIRSSLQTPPTTLVLIGGDDAVRHALSADPALNVTALPGVSMAEHAARGAAVSSRRAAPVLNLLPAIQRRHTGPGCAHSRGLLIAAALAALLIPSALLWRAHQYTRIAEDYSRRAGEIYEQRFHAAAPQAGIARFFESEWRAVQMAQKNGTLPAGCDSILPLLRDTVGAVPAKARLRVRRWHVSTDKLEIQAEAAAKADAYSVQQALAAAGLGCELTRIEDAGGGQCRFTLVASVLPPGKGATP